MTIVCGNAQQRDHLGPVQITKPSQGFGKSMGCEGVMISPDFTRAMGLVTFKLEQPIALQLACVSSKSKVNYGACSTILFGNQHVEDTFNVANIDYYDVILGTPFMRQLGITLDFTSLGSIRIGDCIVPRNLPPAMSDDKPKPTANK